jgi:NADH dehydrogenase
LGRRVVPELQEQHHEVRCLVHTPGRERVFASRSVDTFYGNVLELNTLTSVFQDVDALVHLVGVIRRQNRTTYERVNRQGVANVVAAAKEARVRRIVLVSAIGASNDPSYPYLYSKWQGEQEVVGSGLPYTIFQPSIMFGTGDEFLNTIAGMVKVAPIVPVVGSGRNRLQPIAAEDVARCVALSLSRQDLQGKTVELGGPEQLSYNEIVAIVARTIGQRALRLHLPVWLTYLAAIAMQILPRPPVTTDQLKMLPIRNVTELDVVQKTFGFTPRPLEGNIDFVRSVSFRDGLNILTGAMPPHIRDH